jgi:uncharacterized membrane protein YhaH (DUF805 family)
MDIQQAIKTVLKSYAKFEGRSGRSEYWWWALAYFIAYVLTYIAGSIVGAGEALATLLALALLIPNVAVSVRRFHDIGKSGWWCLIFLIPLVNLIAWLFFFTKPSDGPNQYGEGPQPPAA